MFLNSIVKQFFVNWIPGPADRIINGIFSITPLSNSSYVNLIQVHSYNIFIDIFYKTLSTYSSYVRWMHGHSGSVLLIKYIQELY